MLFVKVLVAELWIAVIVGVAFGSAPDLAFLKHWLVAAIGIPLLLLGHVVVFKLPYLGVLLVGVALFGLSVCFLDLQMIRAIVAGMSNAARVLALSSLLLLAYCPPEQ